MTPSRRRFLAALAAGTSGALAGCVGSQFTAAGRDPPPTTQDPDEPYLARQGLPSTICQTDVVPDFHIQAIDDPAFAADWSGVAADNPDVLGDGTLEDDSVVVGLARGDRGRAYPLDVLWKVEVVNDDLDGPVLVTYCSICQSGTVTSREVGDDTRTFDVSGQLWRPPEIHTRARELDGDVFAASSTDASGDLRVRNSGNLVMYDVETGSYWSQLLLTAICGPHLGTELRPLPAELTTWGDWTATHPDTRVLLPPPHSGVVDQ
jgi:hypothetical protein